VILCQGRARLVGYPGSIGPGGTHVNPVDSPVLMLPAVRDDPFEEETRRLLQARLALMFAVLCGVSLFYGVSHFLLRLLPLSERQSPTLVALVTLLLAAVMGLLVWRCRTGKRSLSELLALDAVGITVPCWQTAAALTQVEPRNEGSASIVLGLTYLFLARAILLPSSGKRTLWIGLLALVPAGLVATWLRIDGFGLVQQPAEWASQASLVFRNVAVTLFLGALTSQVIYGLRRQLQENAQIGQYLLREKVGEGGMGAVYRATHALLRRDTALKVLLPERVGSAASQRFEREVQLTAQLTHPNTVAVFDYGRTPDGVFYYAMEYLDGGDLERLVEYAGPLPPARAVWILEQLCRALGEAHALGLIHRDIKPSNVLLCERGQEGDVAKVCDFGLVKDLKAAQGEPHITQDGALTGTPLYMAPESIAAPESVDARADLYSLGALAHFLLTSAPVFPGRSLVEICAAHLHSVPSPPSALNAAVSAELDAIVLRCLEKQPAARFQSALALRQALLACPLPDGWGAEQAAHWWAQHRQAFQRHCAERRQAQLGSSSRDRSAALRVDVRGRAGGAPGAAGPR
jgi:eukaryotic-like serine/threonine-protein kinase